MRATDRKLVDARLEIRKFNDSALNELKLQKEFNYAENSFVLESIWVRFWKWFWQHVESVNEASGDSLIYLFVIVCGGGIVFALIKLSGMDIIHVLTAKSVGTDIPYSESLENIHQIDFDQNIENAVNNKNYRLAVRIQYLKSLKALSDSGLIDWQTSKTNSAYIHEIDHPEKKKEFSLLTKQFEYIWYGEFYLKDKGYQHIEESFKDFIKKI